MDWNNNDPFDSIVREFFGESPRRRRRHEEFTEGEEEDRVIDFIETDDALYLIFELPGYSNKDVTLALKDRRLEVQAHKQNAANAQEYLAQRLKQGIIIKKTLPGNVLVKSMKHTVKNGIIEVRFDKHD